VKSTRLHQIETCYSSSICLLHDVYAAATTGARFQSPAYVHSLQKLKGDLPILPPSRFLSAPLHSALRPRLLSLLFALSRYLCFLLSLALSLLFALSRAISAFCSLSRYLCFLLSRAISAFCSLSRYLCFLLSRAISAFSSLSCYLCVALSLLCIPSATLNHLHRSIAVASASLCACLLPPSALPLM